MAVKSIIIASGLHQSPESLFACRLHCVARSHPIDQTRNHLDHVEWLHAKYKIHKLNIFLFLRIQRYPCKCTHTNTHTHKNRQLNRHKNNGLGNVSSNVPPLAHIRGLKRIAWSWLAYSRSRKQLKEIHSSQTEERFLHECSVSSSVFPYSERFMFPSFKMWPCLHCRLHGKRLLGLVLELRFSFA